MRVAIINASPAEKNSPSALIAKTVEEEIACYAATERFDFDCAITLEKENLFLFDKWIFIFPVYMKGLPAHILKILMDLEAMAAKRRRNITVYAVALAKERNGEEAETALKMMENWSCSAGVAWGMGVAGGGRDLISYMIRHHRIGFLSYEEALDDLIESVLEEKKMNNTVASPDMPLFLYKRLLKSEQKNIEKKLNKDA